MVRVGSIPPRIWNNQLLKTYSIVAGIMIQWVKLLLASLAFHIVASLSRSHFTSNPALWQWPGKSGRSVWISVTDMGDLQEASGSWLQPLPVLAITATCGLNQQMKDFTLSLSFSLIFKYINKSLRKTCSGNHSVNLSTLGCHIFSQAKIIFHTSYGLLNCREYMLHSLLIDFIVLNTEVGISYNPNT